MRSGFLITPEPVLELCGTKGIRYAAELDDGRGFAAYDVEYLVEVLDLGLLGTIYAEIPPEQQEDWEELWHGPKRQLARGDERFILYPAPTTVPAEQGLALLREDWHPRAAAVVATSPHLLYILVEDGPNWEGPVAPRAPIWNCSVVDYRDERLEAAV